jgi:glycine betaine/choline ABC-type transport system substrate-binding protein
MSELNGRHDEGEAPEDIAEEYLKSVGLIS